VHRFLIDECCSPSLASVAHTRGYEATHVGYLDRLENMPDTVNQLIEVDTSASVSVTAWPPESRNW
jgi:hypothetical protein